MTGIGCAERSGAVTAKVVDNTPWQIRAKRAGLSQKEMSTLMGLTENTVSQQLRGRWQSGVPLYVKLIIVLWENLSQDGRDKVRASMAEIRNAPDEQ